jgi:tRNA G18 (ribose-2'-O)-methylase SpoU
MTAPIRIDSADDPRIEAYLSIRDREIVGRKGSFVAEGSVVLRKLLGSRAYAPQSALILENRLDGIEDAVSAMQGRHIPVYVASRAVMDAIAGFPMHRGVLAIGAASRPTSAEEILAALPADATTLVVCVGIANHDNIGAIFRNAAGLGADAILYDATSCDPFYRKAIRVSVGSVFDMPNARFDDVDRLYGTLKQAGFTQIGLTPSGTTELSALPGRGRYALYLGAEGPGLPVPLLEKLETVRIDMPAGFDSLNVAAASAIALYQLRMRRSPR